MNVDKSETTFLPKVEGKLKGEGAKNKKGCACVKAFSSKVAETSRRLPEQTATADV